MKIFYKIALSLSIIILITSCDQSTKEATDTATQFLDAFVSNDFQTTKTLCNETISEIVSHSEEKYNSIPEEIKKEFDELSKNIKYEITGSEKLSKDSVLIKYTYTIPELPAVKKDIILKKIDKNWVVVEL